MYLKLGKRDIDVRLIAGVTGGLAVIALLVTVAVMLPAGNVDNQSRQPEVEDPARSWVSAGDLLLPDELEEATRLRWVPYRETRERWTEEEGLEHWVDPRAIGLDVLDAEVTSGIHEMLEEVP